MPNIIPPAYGVELHPIQFYLPNCPHTITLRILIYYGLNSIFRYGSKHWLTIQTLPIISNLELISETVNCSSLTTLFLVLWTHIWIFPPFPRTTPSSSYYYLPNFCGPCNLQCIKQEKMKELIGWFGIDWGNFCGCTKLNIKKLSALIPLIEAQINSMVHGTMGYRPIELWVANLQVWLERNDKM